MPYRAFLVACLASACLLAACEDSTTISATTTSTNTGGGGASSSGTAGGGATNTGGMAGGGAGGTASGGGGGNPADDCDACVDPLFGIGGVCQAALEDCEQDTDCEPWIDCTNDCFETAYTAGCFDACDALHAKAASLYAPLRACILLPAPPNARPYVVEAPTEGLVSPQPVSLGTTGRPDSAPTMGASAVRCWLTTGKPR